MVKVRLIDEREVDSSSDEFRHECEARAILAMPTKGARQGMLNLIEEMRGTEARRRLERTMLVMWKSNRASR